MPRILLRFLATSLLVVVALIANSDEKQTVIAAEDTVTEADDQLLTPALTKDVEAEQEMMTGGVGAESEVETESIDPAATDVAKQEEDPARDQEEIWMEISGAISSLNEVVGDNMFLDLQRKDGSRMEVRVDAEYWQRVRYQTRVDLKNDISNIWHLYVKQYHGSDYSSVRFIDDTSGKTIDIFTQAN